MIQVDARGLSCPQPVLMAKKAMEESKNSYAVIVDNETAMENVKRFMTGKGYDVKIDAMESDYVLKASK
ncbi:MAG: sulfurtransferase TusA family protein [Proteocatella sp.]